MENKKGVKLAGLIGALEGDGIPAVYLFIDSESEGVRIT